MTDKKINPAKLKEVLAKIKGKQAGGRIENWHVIELGDIKIVRGIVFGDPRWADGGPLTTSQVVEITEDETLLVTRNTFYELGEKAKK